MLVSLNWLQQYVDLEGQTPEELAEKITKSGIEVDSIQHIAEKSTNVVVGHVLECGKHPDADKLNVTKVDVGDETLQIVCGAPNIAQGQKVAVAKPGAVLPGNFKIKKAKLRGVESFGMICSLQELGIDEKYVPKEYASGIFVFPEDAVPGTPVEELLNLDDAVLEFDLTPNRADCLNMLGAAYEVATILDKPLKLPEPTFEPFAEQTADFISVKSEDAELNPYYAAFVIKDIEVKPSPLWMRNRLMAAGIRPINNVVDITNYVLLEYGQPLHAFDYDRFGTKEVVVRSAREGEQLTTLDGKERTLSAHNLVITNGTEPVALAGVMGGLDSEVHDGTKTVLLEAAYFDGQSIRSTVKETGLRSDASTRYEKGIDPNRVYEAGVRACQLLELYAGGKVCAGPVVFDELDKTEKVVKVDAAETNRRLGTEIKSEEIADIFRKLRFSFEQNGNDFTVTVPTRRMDISIFEDMLEEIARVYGYDHLPFTLPRSATRGELTETQRLKRLVKRFIEGAGLAETLTYSLTDDDSIDKLISPDVQEQEPKAIKLAMPMTEDHKYLRLSLLPEILRAVTYNKARSNENIGLFELGSVFISKEEVLSAQPHEQLRLAGALAGLWEESRWQGEVKKVDFYVAKGIVEGLFRYLGLTPEFSAGEVGNMHPGRTAIVKLSGRTVGFVGQVHPLYAKAHDLAETYVFDLNMEEIFKAYEELPSFAKIPKFPSVSRDIALVLDQNVEAGNVQKKIAETGAPLVKRVDIFDVYQGEHLPEGKKSIAYHLVYQDPEKTLTDEEVEASYKQIVDAVTTDRKSVV